MPVVKDTVDRLMKGYDIRLRPDFGGEESKRAFESFNMHVMMCMMCMMCMLCSDLSQATLSIRLQVQA